MVPEKETAQRAIQHGQGRFIRKGDNGSWFKTPEKLGWRIMSWAARMSMATSFGQISIVRLHSNQNKTAASGGAPSDQAARASSCWYASTDKTPGHPSTSGKRVWPADPRTLRVSPCEVEKNHLKEIHLLRGVRANSTGPEERVRWAGAKSVDSSPHTQGDTHKHHRRMRTQGSVSYCPG